jgi:hypothetical protein
LRSFNQTLPPFSNFTPEESEDEEDEEAEDERNASHYEINEPYSKIIQT